jgi:hypothetical protein
MRGFAVAVAVLAYAALAGRVFGQEVRPVRPLPGYKCMMLNLTQQQFMTVRVPVRAQPFASAPEVGWAGANVAVRYPLHIVNGFIEALFPTGATVWIESDRLRPYKSLSDPAATCTPAIMSNGKPGLVFAH